METNKTQLNDAQTREVVTFDTTSKEEAYNWANRMENDGYSVSITFDETTGNYHCVAKK